MKPLLKLLLLGAVITTAATFIFAGSRNPAGRPAESCCKAEVCCVGEQCCKPGEWCDANGGCISENCDVCGPRSAASQQADAPVKPAGSCCAK
jgi:hypothetical protein